MKVIPEPLDFEWDEGNLHKSYEKHGITPEEAEEIFTDKNLGIIPDMEHSHVEERLVALGKTSRGRNLFVVFTVRNGKIRIISARRMHRKEVKKYEEA